MRKSKSLRLGGSVAMTRLLLKAIMPLTLLASPMLAQAARVAPMIVELEPVGRQSVARIELTNDNDRDIPYEVRMVLGEISETGELMMTAADDQFLVFPTQAIVESRSQQVFRIQYVGDPEMAQSTVYYMSIQQIPVEFEGDSSQVQVVVNYNVLVNVVPDGTFPEAAVSDIEPAVVEERPGFNIRVSNVGTRYFLAGLADWSIRGTAEDGTEYSASYNNDELTREIGVGVVGPGRARLFFVPTDTPLVAGTIQVDVNP